MKRQCRTATEGPSVGQAGLTLLELLVAMTVLALLLTALAGSLRFGARTWDASRDGATNADNIFVARNIIRRTLSAARPAPKQDDRRNDQVAFNGQSDALTFVTELSSDPRGGGLYVVELLRGGSDGMGELLMRWRPYRAARSTRESGASTADHRTLLGDVEMIKFSYFGRQDDTEDPAWFDTWSDKRTLPDLVTVTVVPANDKDGPWPPVSVPIRIRSATPSDN